MKCGCKQYETGGGDGELHLCPEHERQNAAEEAERGNRNPNENCLQNIKCPNCGSYERFAVLTQLVMEWTDDGSDWYKHNSETEMVENGFMECLECHHTGVVEDFKEE